LSKNIKLFQLITGLLITNIAGFFLRFFEFDTYFILIGFRFHISILLSFLFILYKSDVGSIKDFFVDLPYKRYSVIIVIVALPIAAIYLFLLVSGKISIADPDYFYEFGLSSIVDYPIYLIWNLPQLFMFFLFLNIIKSEKHQFIIVTLLSVLLFTFEFVPIHEEINYMVIAGMLLSSLIAALLVINFKNIYLFSISIFSILWISILSFGSSSKKLINILFASQYEGWEGFFAVSKELSAYIIPAYFGIVLIILFLFHYFKIKVPHFSSTTLFTMNMYTY